MKNILMSLVRGYQKGISPMFPPSCRYYPTCSHYTLEALEQHGALKGSTMGIARILRCNPFVEGGFDPVPDHFTLKRQHLKPAMTDDDFEGTIDPKEQENRWIEHLLNKYQTEIIFDPYPIEELLEDHFELQSVPMTNLNQTYNDEVTQQAVDYGVSKPEFKLFKVTQLKDEEILLDSSFESTLNEVMGDQENCYFLIEKTLGLMKASSQELGIDLVLASGIEKNDVENYSPRLKHYLTVLDQLEV